MLPLSDGEFSKIRQPAAAPVGGQGGQGGVVQSYITIARWRTVSVVQFLLINVFNFRDILGARKSTAG